MGPDWYVGILAAQTGDGEPWSLMGTGSPAPKAAERFEVRRAAVRNGAGAGEHAWLLQGTLHTRVSGDGKRYVSICVRGSPRPRDPAPSRPTVRSVWPSHGDPHQLGAEGGQTSEPHLGVCFGCCDFSQVRVFVTVPGRMRQSQHSVSLPGGPKGPGSPPRMTASYQE